MESSVELGTLAPQSPEPVTGSEPVFPLLSQPELKLSKPTIRSSLRASTLDGIFATVFSNIAGGVLLSNFLVELHANAIEVGMLASIPMVANLMQPFGAVLSDRTSSRHNYCLWIYVPARLIWLLLLVGIGAFCWGRIENHTLVIWTLAIVFITHVFGAFGSASWLAWLAALVPRRLRGRYFSIRNSVANLTCLICVPIAGWFVSTYSGGSISGYGIVLLIGIIAGIVSIGFQYFMADVNPKEQIAAQGLDPRSSLSTAIVTVSQDANFVRFLIYLSLWMFAVNLSAPF